MRRRAVYHATKVPGTKSTVEVPSAPAGERGDLTETLIGTSVWTDEMVSEAGIPVVEVPVVTVGGGLGSFALVDFLRIAGVRDHRIRVLTDLERPYQTYRYLAGLSQIRDHHRLRSDSMTQVDNIWGFPSYAVREAFQKRTVRPLCRVLTEPVLSEFYNPTGELLYRGIDRETERIGWSRMLMRGQVRMVRRRLAGGYFAILTPPPGSLPTRRVALRATYVHLAVGYPSLRFLTDLQEYRSRYNDYARVVNAYEPHDHVYANLIEGSGTVIIRGAGIVASRLLERLIDDRDEHGSDIEILHVLRRYPDRPEGPRTFRRPAADGWTYQPFTFPKAAGGGQLRDAVRKREGKERADFIRSLGGTTTAKRRRWQDQLARGRREGWYRVHVGEVESVRPSPAGKVLTAIGSNDADPLELEADYIIDATGLQGDIEDSRVLADLLAHSGARKNALGRLDVGPEFAIRGTENGAGRMFASGTITLGGYLAPVDSFWGVQHAALEIVDELARQGFCKRIGTVRSVRQWWRWATGRPPE
ncbi:MAG: hypothetical protein NVSMB25_10720 [Thermoleophilaceae bacterium]